MIQSGDYSSRPPFVYGSTMGTGWFIASAASSKIYISNANGYSLIALTWKNDSVEWYGSYQSPPLQYNGKGVAYQYIAIGE